MSIRNGEPDLADVPWTHLAIIGITIVMALVLGYGVGFALNGKPESAGVAAKPPDAAQGPGPGGTPTVTPTVTPTGVPTGTPNGTPTGSPTFTWHAGTARNQYAPQQPSSAQTPHRRRQGLPQSLPLPSPRRR